MNVSWFQMYDFRMLWFSKCNDFKYFGFERVITLKVLWFVEVNIGLRWKWYSIDLNIVLK